jgi:hypothetical protein
MLKGNVWNKKKKQFYYLFIFIYFYLFIFFLDELDMPFVVSSPTSGVRTKQVAALPQRQPLPPPQKVKRPYNRKPPFEMVKTEIRRIVNIKEMTIFEICDLITDVIRPYVSSIVNIETAGQPPN